MECRRTSSLVPHGGVWHCLSSSTSTIPTLCDDWLRLHREPSYWIPGVEVFCSSTPPPGNCLSAMTVEGTLSNSSSVVWNEPVLCSSLSSSKKESRLQVCNQVNSQRLY
uniref:Uncharacterized protein n=1 Tax=Amphora coffeiformis TaxID=265554 RepID=A0A7S3L7Y1_9STRA